MSAQVNQSANQTARQPNPTSRWYKRFFIPLEALVFSLTATFLLSLITKRFEPLVNINPFEAKIADVQLSDACFAFVHRIYNIDPNIIIINVADDNRSVIAQKLQEVDRLKPKVVGLDIEFSEEGDTTGTTRLISVLSDIKRKHNNLVLASLFDKENDATTYFKAFYTQLNSYNDSRADFHYGYVEGHNPDEPLRKFTPYLKTESGKIDTTFELMLIKTGYGENKFLELNKDHKKWEIINYRHFDGNENRYRHFDKIPDDANEIKDKIVLFGKFNNKVIDDLHFTPLNQRPFNRSLPDMDGVEYHAQILSMIINRDFLMDVEVKWLFIVLLSYSAILYFKWLRHSYPVLAEFLVSVSLFGLTLMMLFISICLMQWASVKLEPLDFMIPIGQCSVLMQLFFSLREIIEKKLEQST